ncbi:hypothetical protein BpHYR1_041331 [Brachionus plicatilis]|uniref:Uncharacterized protein n=1 Tax=Brachionus plicatilis TaxID=10195 RepID=A0A3M7Q7C1_BRAPC|nr:hypothetical protein BpHYR1_041331 [Brachionus plicatilis]
MHYNYNICRTLSNKIIREALISFLSTILSDSFDLRHRQKNLLLNEWIKTLKQKHEFKSLYCDILENIYK